ncbi:MAG: [LysW]-aminoadipate kinase [Anaerolineae bacterium]|nr:[LysW]-aminoadipate kinase [Anaerolineae bacterium]
MNVLKLGGGAGIGHDAVLRDLAGRVRAGENWLLVHGTSAAANRLGEQLGHPARTLTTAGGHVSRYTDPQTLEIYCMAAGAVNLELTAALTRLGVPAVGLTSAVRAQRHAAIRALVNGRQVVVRDDQSGAVTGVDADLVRALLAAGRAPVVAPIALGDQGERLNVDGDLAAAAFARALDAETLVILSNVPGLLRDVADPASLVPGFALGELARYESLAAGRMKKKLMAVQEACAGRAILADARIESPLSAALAGAGTHIIAERAGHVAHV